MPAKNGALYSLLILLLMGCTTDHQNNDPIEGVWKSIGSGTVIQIQCGEYTLYDITRISCFPVRQAAIETIGYVQVKAMWLYAQLNLSDSLVRENGYVDTYVDAFHQMDEARYIELEREGVRNVMDKVIKDLLGSDVIIIDIRFNGGGQDAVSLEILSRFNDEKRQVATEKLRHGEHYSPVLPIFLEPSFTPYLKPVFVLTSPQTGSAAETFALATLSLDHINRVGSPTSGALSTALEKKLPNGWDFALSNELFMDNQGVFYENTGIPVDYELNYPADRQAFFRSIANDLEGDKQKTLKAIEALTRIMQESQKASTPPGRSK